MRIKLLFVIIFIVFLSGCNNQVTDIKITGENELYINESIKLEIEGSVYDSYEWISYNPSIATVDNGTVFGVSKGIVTISIISEDNILATFEIVVKEKNKLSIIGEKTVEVGKSIELKVKSNDIEDTFTWSSSNNDIAVVKDGIVSAINVGIVAIEVNSIYQGNSRIEIVVFESLVPESIEITNVLDKYIIGQGPYQLHAVAYPNYSSQEFTWSTSSKNATINQVTGEIDFTDEGLVYVVCRSKLNNLIFEVVLLNVFYDEGVEITNIMFIGNSLTYVNDIPLIVKSMAKAGGKVVHTEMIAPGGNTLSDIYNGYKYSIIEKLKNRQFDYLIIQEASSSNFTNFNSFLSNAIKFKELANTYQAELILYQTWAYRENCVSLQRLDLTRSEMQDLIIKSYSDVSQATNSRINPVGEVFYQFSLKYPSIELYKDDNHASLVGSYLSSCVHYVSLFKESVIGNSYDVNLDENTKLLIQTFVSNYILNNE